MENPTILHQIAFLYIGFAQLSNNEIPLAQEMEIKRKIAEWLDLSYKNVDQYEMVMRESLQWFNTIEDKEKQNQLLDIAKEIASNENMDLVMVKKVLSEIRDIAISNGRFDQGEKNLHDKIASKMGVDIITTDPECEIPSTKSDEELEDENSEDYKSKSKGIGFKYGSTIQTKKKGKPKK